MCVDANVRTLIQGILYRYKFIISLDHNFEVEEAFGLVVSDIIKKSGL